MPQYYNLSKYSDAEGIISIYTVTDELMIGYFSLFIILVVGIFITYIRLKKNDDPVNAIVLGSFYSLMLSMAIYFANIFYSGISKPGLYIFVPAVILVMASTVKWYNNR